jgi:hypothetical protein
MGNTGIPPTNNLKKREIQEKRRGNPQRCPPPSPGWAQNTGENAQNEGFFNSLK